MGPNGDLPVRVSGNFESNSVNALHAALLLGQGLTLVPSLVVADELKSGTLVPVLSEFLSEEFTMDALYPSREHLPAKVRSFIDLAAKNLHHSS